MTRLARALMPLGFLLGFGLVLPGCGLSPVYSGGTHGQVSRTLKGVHVPMIAGPNGWLVHKALVQRLGGQDDAAPYRLEVELDDEIESSAVRRDETVARERRILRARYRLIEAASGTVLIDATAGADVGIDVVSSDYATLSAEQSALEHLATTLADQLVTRMAAFARETQPTAPGPDSTPPAVDRAQ